MPLPFALDHINLWLLQDGPGWTVVDTGVALDGLKDCWRKLLPVYPLLRQIVTHWHPDHIGLAGWLQQETGAPLWITESEYLTAQMVYAQIGSFGNAPMVEMFRQHGLDAQRVEEMKKVSGTYQRNCSPAPLGYRRMFDGERIDVGGRAWRVMVGHGHSPEHAALYCDELRVLISGDMLLPRITTNVSARPSTPDGNLLGLFLDSITRFEPLPQDTLVLPSHGAPFRGLHARIAALREHHQGRFAALLAAIDHPMTAAELVPVIFSRPLDDAFQAMFAMGETIAHLNYLEHKQQIAGSESNGIIRFVKLNSSGEK
ncbi:MAG: MBL fold metallo-hydrolase [Betaproteobacteria bacterium]|nr:MBL fold metallo-hydrolase [Betaproteobacteria bacterium]